MEGWEPMAEALWILSFFSLFCSAKLRLYSLICLVYGDGRWNKSPPLGAQRGVRSLLALHSLRSCRVTLSTPPLGLNRVEPDAR